MNFRKKFDFLDQGYIEEYIEELYSKENIRISLSCKSKKIWVEINDDKIEALKENKGVKIEKIAKLIEDLNGIDCSPESQNDFRLSLLEEFYEDLIV